MMASYPASSCHYSVQVSRYHNFDDLTSTAKKDIRRFDTIICLMIADRPQVNDGRIQSKIILKRALDMHLEGTQDLRRDWYTVNILHQDVIVVNGLGRQSSVSVGVEKAAL